MYEVVEVKVREGGGVIYYSTNNLDLKLGDYVIIEVERGLDYGEVLSPREVILDKDVEHPLRKIVRKAVKTDLEKIKKNDKKAKQAFELCFKKIGEHKLGMKLIQAEYSFDCNKVIFYFTAKGRIDFRNLVRDLAAIFKIRIEMRQIGVRDEARLMGGFGPCGRPLCCTKFLKEFGAVTMRMAREQGLPLNPAKISGLCGRLMCCLCFEYPYKPDAERKKTDALKEDAEVKY
ncbi:MAG: stage 0 sporulation protein [Candidatus Omnitrophica bacterium]|nr:stage 0 sporulation protein [Candidatus Omnitrophota bacterium]